MRSVMFVLVFAVAVSCTPAIADDSYVARGFIALGEIIVDVWGVPYICGGTHYDAFFVQGFNAARDRLWQIDTWRRRGLGKMADVLGPE